MDIRKLQRVIVDGLENVKGHNIAVFNTEHLSPLFERVIIASGTSNRQTKALAASVRDAVKSSGFGVLRTEGEDNGEWIIVDCGAAVVHLMQPTIREYYHLEEIWGDKPVKMKLDTAPRRLVKAEEVDEPVVVRKAPAGKSAARKTVARSGAATQPIVAAKKSPTGRTAARTAGATSPSAAAKSAGRAPAPKSRTAGNAAGKAVVKVAGSAAGKAAGTTAGAFASRVRTMVVGVAKTARKTAAGKTAAHKPGPRAAAPGVTRTVGVKRTPAAKKAGRGG